MSFREAQSREKPRSPGRVSYLTRCSHGASNCFLEIRRYGRLPHARQHRSVASFFVHDELDDLGFLPLGDKFIVPILSSLGFVPLPTFATDFTWRYLLGCSRIQNGRRRPKFGFSASSVAVYRNGCNNEASTVVSSGHRWSHAVLCFSVFRFLPVTGLWTIFDSAISLSLGRACQIKVPSSVNPQTLNISEYRSSHSDCNAAVISKDY